jgi:membrane-bound metal-dependent hydrolase YbcI (DUF457 family)
LLLGIEKVSIEPGNTDFTPLNFVSYPFTHSLLAVLIWALLFGGIYYFVKKDRRSATLLALMVISHWFLDLVVHRPDLPLSLEEETKVGLGLWNSKAATIAVELLIFSVGIALYKGISRATNKTGEYALWALVIFFLMIYFLSAFGDPPPNATVIGYLGMAQWLFVLWAYWVDRNRIVETKFDERGSAYLPR